MEKTRERNDEARLQRKFARLFALFTLSLGVLSCSALIETQGFDATAISTSIPVYSCAYFTEGVDLRKGYDSLAACQTASNSNCTNTWETFPTGGVALCYFPPAGFESCLVTPITWDWIYTPYSDWCDTRTAVGPDEVYKQTRSVITCSSALCFCGNPIVTTQTCVGAGAGAGQCGSFGTNPLTEIPAPSFCP